MNLVVATKPKLIDYNTGVIAPIEEKLKEGLPITESETHTLLRYACGKARDLLNESDDETFENKDLYASSMIYNYLNDLGVNVLTNNTANIDYGVKSNNFLIANINTDFYGSDVNISYLIDPTFIQFLNSEKCNENNEKSRNGVIYQKPDVGYYIHPLDQYFLDKLIEDGYDYFSTSLASIYGNAFANTKVPTDNKNIIALYGYVYYDKFIVGDNTKLLGKEELRDLGFILEPQKNKSLILDNIN